MQDYDLGRKDFDFLELQSFRRETILQYSLINRSEQLRILLLSLSAVISACAPAIAAELFQREGGADNSVAALGISAVSALGLGGLAYREKAARGQKLRRLEREFSIGELSATQPASPLAGARTVQLAELRDKQCAVALPRPCPRPHLRPRPCPLRRPLTHPRSRLTFTHPNPNPNPQPQPPT